MFRATSPLTPGDAQALHVYLMDLDIREDPLGVLTNLLKDEYRVEPRNVFPFPAPSPPENWQEKDPNRCLIHNVIYAHLPREHQAVFVKTFDVVAAADAQAIESLLQEAHGVIAEIIQTYHLPIQPGCPFELDEDASTELLGAIGMINTPDLVANEVFAYNHYPER